MKKTLLTLGAILLIVVPIAFLACNKNVGTSSSLNSNPNNIPPNETVTASLQGRVVDQNGVPVQGAAVTSGTASATTDINGLFTFSSISLSSRFGYVKAVKSGFFTGSRSIITNPAASNYVNIQLIPLTQAGSFPAPTGGKVAVQAGDTATFAASSVVEAASGAAYSGTVYVYAIYLDPTDSNLYKYMPGDLRGIGTNGYETGLQSFGMMDVEMQDASGNKLQLASGQQATLTMAIPASLQSLAPATIPLWYFNDTTGIWMQQGSATRQGNNYVGQVGHFTYWNCDAPMGTVNFSVYLKDQHGNPLAYTYIAFKSAAYGTRGGFTDSAGFAQGLIPQGVELQMQVQTECGTMIGGANVGPALTDQNLGTVVVTIDYSGLLVKGTVVNCSSMPVDSGYVTIQVDGLNYAAVVSNGAFLLPVSRCYSTTAQVKVTATDLAASQTGSPVLVSASSPVADTVNVGQLVACSGGSPTPPPPTGPTSDEITAVVNGTTYSWIAPDEGVQQNYVPVTQFEGQNFINYQTITISASRVMSGTGTYSGVINMQVPGYSTGSISLDVLSFGAVNSDIYGTYTGSVYDSTTSANVPVSGLFNVTRSF